jgi:hypothetical protein
MARVKRCEEEFNPWPPFVDVFSSVVLVLLLFILVLIVNVAYYTQFNTKVDSHSKTKSIKDNLQAGMDVSDMISLHKIVKPKLDTTGRDSMFSGGKDEGNVLSSSTKTDKKVTQDVKRLSSEELMVAYNDIDIFLQKDAKAKIKSFIDRNNKNDRKIIISMAYPSNVISTTMKKKISISRIVNVKNALKKFGVKLSNMKIKIKAHEDKKYKNGYIKIKIN